jgi:hypothetical protein
MRKPMKRLLFILIYLIALCPGLLSQEIVTDRPDQTESSVTVPAQNLQFEVGVGRISDDIEKQYVFPTTLTRYGLTKGIELRLAEHLFGTKNKQTSDMNLGLSDLELGTKIQIFRRDNVTTEIAFISHITVPTGSDALTKNKVGTINKIAISHGLSNRLDIGYNMGYSYFGEGKGDLTYSLAIGIGFTEKFGSYVETFGGLEEFSGWISNFDTGLTYLVKQNLQIDFSFGLGINQKMNYISCGLSWNISRKN